MPMRYKLDAIELTLRYWQARDTFGDVVVSQILADPGWADKYPQVIQQVRSRDAMIRSQTTLPGEIVYAMAQHRGQGYDFYLRSDGKVLYAVPYGAPPTLYPQIQEYATEITPISAPEALQKCGAYCVCMAVEHGTGYVGEEDIRRADLKGSRS